MKNNRIWNIHCLAVGVGWFFPIFANAQYAMLQGNFASSNANMQIIVLDKVNGDIAASASVVLGACSGNIAGLGKAVGQKITFSSFVKYDNREACVITVEFDDDFKVGKLHEAQSCQPFHGAACSWEGQKVIRQVSKSRSDFQRP